MLFTFTNALLSVDRPLKTTRYVNVHRELCANCALFALYYQNFDLTHEIGYNLALIYKSSNSPQLALDCLRKYCTV